MTPQQLKQLRIPLRKICQQASQAIMAIYNSPRHWERAEKEDGSPVTAADLAAHKIIASQLSRLNPRLPVLSEESAKLSWSTRKQWGRYWLVDPLDGTREFLERNDQFTINIALIENGYPTLGIVHLPAVGISYFGGIDIGSCKFEDLHQDVEPIFTHKLNSSHLRVVASHRHGNQQIEPVLLTLQQQGLEIDKVQVGSSLKFCLIAEGSADFYPRIGPTSEWDTAAAQAVVEGAGGVVTDIGFNALQYNAKEDLLNPYFLVFGDPTPPWRRWLDGGLPPLR